MIISKDRQFVDALARGLSVLECLSRAQRPLGNGELSRQLGLPPSTVSRLTYTLTELGYLRRSPIERTYQLTPKNLTLGYPLLSDMSLVNRVRPYVRHIHKKTEETVALAVMDGLYVSFLEVMHGSKPSAVRLAPGGRLRISVSAAGVAITAALPERQRWSILNRLQEEMEQRHENFREFEKSLNDCLRLGYASVRNMWQKGVGGLSVPLLYQGELAALTIPIATNETSRQRMREDLLPLLLAAVREIGVAPLGATEA